MAILSSIAAIRGVSSILSVIKDNSRGIVIIAIILLSVLCYGLYSKWRDAVNKNKEYVELQAQNARASRDATQKWKVTVRGNYERELALQDSVIANLKDSLDIKDRQIIGLERIKFGKTTVKVVTEYDTLYEFIELDPSIPNVFTVKHDDCITLHGWFTKNGLETKVIREFDLVDLTYQKRSRLFGWKWTPRIGKKQTFQTLITNCGDTIRNNQQITFEK